MSGTAFRLARTIGRSYAVDPEDTRRMKVALRDLGYFETPLYGLTPYPDERMFRGIERFQEDFGLRRDGIVKPDGETAAKLAAALAGRDRVPESLIQDPSAPDRSQAVRVSSTTDVPPIADGGGRRNGGQLAFAPAVPVIVEQIAVLFGMSVAAAYAWWTSLSEGDRKELRAKVEAFASRKAKGQAPSEAECEDLNRVDTDTCKGVTRRRGARAGQRCHASASQRYAACLKGDPRDRWPPLDTWNN